MPITHAKVSGKSDGADATQVQPSDWNDEHVGGSGLPSQWTDGGNGDVTATVDDVAATPFSLEAMTGQTGRLLRLVDEDGNVVGTVSPSGGVSIRPTSLPVDSEFPGEIPASLVVTGFDGQDAASDLFYAHTFDSAGYSRINSDGSWTMAPAYTPSPYATGGSALEVGAGPGSVAPLLAIQSGTLGGTIALLTSDDPAAAPLVLTGATAQTAPMLRASTSDGEIYLMPDGTIAFATYAGEPPDGAFYPGLVGFWFDDTNGASKLMIKGKSADGTVVTATVPLT